VTDRAHRYRAQKNVTGPRKCVLCGSTRNIDVMHLDGNESHDEKKNLAYGCRSCNGKLAAAFKRAGMGRPTNQYNPAGSTVPTFGQYAWAVSQGGPRGHRLDTGSAHDEAGAVIHATPKHKRIEYARRIAEGQRARRRTADNERWNPAARSGAEARRKEVDEAAEARICGQRLRRGRSDAHDFHGALEGESRTGYTFTGICRARASWNGW
jgi:hypothetical protein